MFDSFLSRDDDEEEPELDYQIPLKGMVFMSEMEAEKSFHHYAENIGFKMRKGKVQRPSNEKHYKMVFSLFMLRFSGQEPIQSDEKQVSDKRNKNRLQCPCPSYT